MMTEPERKPKAQQTPRSRLSKAQRKPPSRAKCPATNRKEPTLWRLVTERTAQELPARCASNAAERLRNGIKDAARLKLEAERAAQDTYGVPADPSIRSKPCSTRSPWLGLRNAGRAPLVKRGQPLAA
jgi:hypothetical protein